VGNGSREIDIFIQTFPLFQQFLPKFCTFHLSVLNMGHILPSIFRSEWRHSGNCSRGIDVFIPVFHRFQQFLPKFGIFDLRVLETGHILQPKFGTILVRITSELRHWLQRFLRNRHFYPDFPPLSTTFTYIFHFFTSVSWRWVTYYPRWFGQNDVIAATVLEK